MSTMTDDDLTTLLTEAAESYDVPAHGPDEVLSTLAAEPASKPVVRRRWVQLSVAASVATVGLFVAVAVGGGAATQLGTSARDGFIGTVGSDRDALRRLPGSSDDSAEQPAALDSSGAKTGAAGGGANAPSTAGVGAPPAAADGAEGRVVKTGEIGLVTDDGKVSAVLSAVQAAAKAQGGYVASSSSNEYGKSPSGEVTVRVPAERFEALVAAIRGLDAEVRTAITSGKDVSAQYADLEAQLRTLKASRERFLTILSRANSISEILSVQQRVDAVTAQIDRIEGSRRLLASQSDLSTLSVTVSEADDPSVRVTERRGGLSAALHDAKDGFVSGIEALVRHSGRALVWLLCLAAAFLLGRLAWRVARRRLV